jgi:DNA-binding LytR/AlgR family response regulator
MTIKCLLVDDEPPALRVLANHIALIPTLTIVGQCRNAIEALEILHQQTVDLLFLDIRMPKILGTDFARNLTHPPMIIFVTAYRDFAAESYELDAVDYLVKPVSFDRFFKSISKVQRLMGQESQVSQVQHKKNTGAFVYMKVDRNMQKVMLQDIQYIESWKDYIKVFLNGGKCLLVKQSITATENMLADHQFIRIHRSFIVSVARITAYNHMSVTTEAMELPIGRLYKQSVMEFFQSVQ